jgi:hypothetical protein
MQQEEASAFVPKFSEGYKLKVFQKKSKGSNELEEVDIIDDSERALGPLRQGMVYINVEKGGFVKKFESPDVLWEAAVNYFKWCDENPWVKNEPIRSGPKAGDIIAIPTARPYTQKGLEIHLGIHADTYRKYRSKEGYEEYWDTVEMIDKIIYTQKFEGAAVGNFNANIIGKDLGLIAKSETDVHGEVNHTVTGITIL